MTTALRPLALSLDKKYGVEDGVDFIRSTHVFDAKTGLTIFSSPDTAFSWLSGDRLIGIKVADDNKSFAWQIVDVHGHVISSKPLKLIALPDSSAEFGPDGYPPEIDRITANPAINGDYLCYSHWHTTGYGDGDYVYDLNLKAGTMTYIACPQFMAWSPSGKEFCCMSYTTTSRYSRRSDGSYRMVWTQPLEVVNVKTFAVTVIQGGLVSICSADWRR